MRRIVMFNRVTADGFFAGPDGNLDWIVPDEEIDKTGAQGVPSTDAFLFGRRTYEQFASYWPRALETPSPEDPHRPGRSSPQHRAFAVALNELPKLVFSRTLKDPSWKNSRVLRELDPRAIEDMKQQPGKDMVVMGSGSIVSQLTQHGLIDEYTFIVTPVFLGAGQSLIKDLSRRVRLDLAEAKPYPSGNVLLRYTRAKQ